MIPQTFEEWKRCIEFDCGIKLTKQFCDDRLMILRNTGCDETKKFISLYGAQHYSNIIDWFSAIH